MVTPRRTNIDDPVSPGQNLRHAQPSQDVKTYYESLKTDDIIYSSWKILQTPDCVEIDADKVIFAGNDNFIEVRETRPEVRDYRLEGHHHRITALLLLGNVLISGSMDLTIRIWDIKGQQQSAVCTVPSYVRCLGVVSLTTVPGGEDYGQPRSKLRIICGYGHSIGLWDFSGSNTLLSNELAELTQRFEGHGGTVSAIAACDNTLASGSHDKTVRIWTIDSGQQLHKLVGHASDVNSVAIHTAKHRCVSGSSDLTYRIWSLSEGSCLHIISEELSETCRFLHSQGLLSPVNVSGASTLCTSTANTISSFSHGHPFKILSCPNRIWVWDDRTQMCTCIIRKLNGVSLCRAYLTAEGKGMFAALVKTEDKMKMMRYTLPVPQRASRAARQSPGDLTALSCPNKRRKVMSGASTSQGDQQPATFAQESYIPTRANLNHPPHNASVESSRACRVKLED